MTILLSLEQVEKRYPAKDGRETTALDKVDLEIRRGEFMAVVGPSGCGKSTLLQIAAGLLKPTSGKVLLGSTPIVGPPPEIVYLFQQYTKSLFPWRTVAQNVALALEGRRGVAARERADVVRSHLAMVDLADFADHFPWQLSGGMQQRVAIARALVAKPKVLLMDEPFSAVDALTRLELQQLILDIWHQSDDLTVMLVTHDVDEAVYLADRIAVLSRRPSRISQLFETGLPRPRKPIETREDPTFLKHRHELLDTLLEHPHATA